MKPNVDLFWSFRSPYSYLATPQALKIPRKYAVNLHFRPVLPLAVRQPGFFSPENLKRAKYILMDLDDNHVIIAHLGMSGRMVITAPDVIPGPHDHVEDHGR